MEKTPAIRRWFEWFAFPVLAGAILVAGAILAPAILAQQETPAKRTYESGPLSTKDFAGQSDAAKVRMGTSAFTVCELQWKYDTRWQDDRDGQVVMKVTKLDLDCVVLPDQSWNLRPNDQSLLAHEQGHFELWYINTLRARIAWLKKKGEGGIDVTAATRKECEMLIEKKVNTFGKEFADAALSENQDYDRTTAKGTDTAAQAEVRRIHQATIKQLESQLKPSPRKSK